MIDLPSPASPLPGTAAELQAAFNRAAPVKHLILDNFLLPEFAEELYASLPSLTSMPKSRDYVFSDKRELSTIDHHSDASKALHNCFASVSFSDLLGALRGKSVFLDPEYMGGGFHAGAPGSFLDLHTDFNMHPLHKTWFRELNILLYLNPGWGPSWGGELLLTDEPTVDPVAIAPLFNRLVIMESTDRSFHGYRPTTFPPGTARRSIAAYAYSFVESGSVARRTTNWTPQDASRTKRILAGNWNRIVLTKNRFLGSGTAKNRRVGPAE